jgi:hypothetical protein
MTNPIPEMQSACLIGFSARTRALFRQKGQAYLAKRLKILEIDPDSSNPSSHREAALNTVLFGVGKMKSRKWEVQSAKSSMAKLKKLTGNPAPIITISQETTMIW